MPLSGPSSFLSGQPEQPGKLRTTPDFTFCAYSNPWRCKGRIEAVVAEPDAPPPGLALFPRVLRWGAPRDSLCQPGQVLLNTRRRVTAQPRRQRAKAGQAPRDRSGGLPGQRCRRMATAELRRGPIELC